MTRHTYFRRFQTRRQAQGVLAVIAALVIAANRGPREWLFRDPSESRAARRRTGPPTLGKPVRQTRVVHRASADRNRTLPAASGYCTCGPDTCSMGRVRCYPVFGGPYLPPGGVARPSLYPQHAMVPSVLTPHVCCQPAATVVNVPPGGVACPAQSSPQHSTVRSVRIPHVCPQALDRAINVSLWVRFDFGVYPRPAFDGAVGAYSASVGQRGEGSIG